MALGAIVNANNAFLPPDFNPTLNHRFVYRPYFGMVDTEKKTGKLTLTYATQIHACVVEVDRETGVVEIVDYAAVDDCGTRIHPQIVEGQVHGATVHAIGAALYEDFVYDEDGQLLTSNFYDYHVPHALDVPSLKTGRDRVAVPVLAARREGDGRGRRRWDPLHLLGDPGRAQAGRRADRLRQLQPLPPRLVDAAGPGVDARQRLGRARMKVEGTKELSAPREVVWQVLNDPAQMAKLMPGVEGFEIKDDRHWQAKVKIPLGLGGLRMTIDFEKVEEREPEFAQLNAKGNGVGAIMNMATQFNLARERHRHDDALGGGREDRRPRRRDGPARSAADHQPAGRQRARRAREAGRRGRCGGHGGAEQGIHPASPEAYDADPDGPTHSTDDES